MVAYDADGVSVLILWLCGLFNAQQSLQVTAITRRELRCERHSVHFASNVLNHRGQ